ncbi:MAG: leucine-rich repeat protein [Roseburia sp.]|nr:leucine-rich repeat protein [Roseburia sp.]
MKRKNLFTLLFVLIACLALALTGCKSDTDNGDGDGNDRAYYTVSFDSCGGSTVESQRVMEGNPARNPETPQRDSYSFIGWYKATAENAEQWNFSTDRVDSDITLYAKWQLAENQTATASLTFDRNSIGYTVTGSTGQEERIIIPEEYDDLPVTEIGESAFAYSRHTSEITYVSIPDTVTKIGLNAFHNQSALVTVDIGGGSALSSIGGNAFSGNGALKTVYIPQSVTEIGDSAFNNCGSLDSISVATSNTAYSGEGNNLIEKATNTLIRGSNNSRIPQSVTAIAPAAFRKANKLTALFIPLSVTTIGNYFIADSTIATVRYQGTEEQWNAIDKSATMWNYGNRDVEVVFGAAARNDVLIVYFSYSGNTASVADEIIARSGGDGVEIIPAVPYTADDVNYNNSDSRSQVEHRTDARPEISDQTYSQIDMSEYNTVIIGYPIWNGDEPMIIRTFIEHYNGLPGKTVHTFSTAASSGGSTAHNSIGGRISGTIGSNLHLTSSTLSSASSRVNNWLSGLDLVSA